MLKDIQVLNEKETRGGFGEGIHEVGKSNEKVVVLTADLAGSLKLGPFMKDFPGRFVQCGIGAAIPDDGSFAHAAVLPTLSCYPRP